MQGSERGGNIIALGLGQGVRLLSGLAVNVLLMRALGVDGYGIYGTVLALVGLAASASNLGMDRLVVRDVSREAGRAPALVGAALATTALLSTGTAGLVVGWAWLTDGRPVVVGSAALAALALGLQSLAAAPIAAFQGLRRMSLGVGGQVAGKAVLLAATAAFLAAGLDVRAVFLAQVLDAAVALAAALWIAWRGFGWAREAWAGVDPGAMARLARSSVPFGLNGLFGAIYLGADVLMLAMLRGDTEVGVYRGAVMLITLFPVVATTITTAAFPQLARRLGDPEGAGELLGFLLRVLLAFGVPAAVGGMLLARELMVLLGGEAFAVSALPFLIMAPLLPLRFVNNAAATTLTALDRQHDRTLGVILAAAFNVGANLVAIPRWGAEGAAATTLVTEVALAVWMGTRLAGRVRGLGLPATLLQVSVAALAMGLVVAAAQGPHVLVRVALGTVVYAVVGWATGALRLSDLERLRRV